MRRMSKWLLRAIGLVLIILVGILALLQTGPGKRLLAAQLSSFLSTPSAGIEIAGIEGWIPLDMRVAHLRLSDRDGTWLEADGITVNWSPSALIGGRILIEEIAATRIALARPPLDSGQKEEEPASNEPFRLPELPKSLPPIIVEQLALPEISLDGPVLGEAATFRLQGSLQANDSGETVAAILDLERTDQPTAFANLEATAGLDPLTLDLALKAGESGGMIAGLIDRPEVVTFAFDLEGKGPLEDWSGHLRADADGLILAEADLDLALTEQPRLVVEGAANPARGLLPNDLVDLVDETILIDLDVMLIGAQALDLKKAAIDIGVATIDAEGSVDFDAGDLALSATLAVPDLAPFGRVAKAPLGGGANASLDVAGTLAAPDGRLDLEANDPTFDDKTADQIAISIRWTATAPLTSDRAVFDIEVEGAASGLALPGATLPDPDVAWNAKLAVPLDGEIAIDRVLVETAGSSLTAKGNIDPASLEGAIDLALSAPSLQQLAAPYGQPMDGKATIEAAIRLAGQAKNVTIDLDATLEDLENMPPGAAELLGSEVGLNARVDLDANGRLHLDRLTADGAGFEFAGKADLDQEDITGRFTLALPDLAVLDPVIADSLGRIELEADLDGDLEAPTADLRVTGKDLVLTGEPIAALDLAMIGRDLIETPSGDLEIALTARDTPASLALDYRLADDMLHLDAIDLKAPETAIGGRLAIALEAASIDGALDGRLADLGALSRLSGQALDGSIDFTLTLAADGDHQDADITLAGEQVGGDFGSIKTVNVDASVQDFKASQGAFLLDAKATLTGFQQDATKIDALVLGIDGAADDFDFDLDFDLDVAGEAIKPFELQAAGTGGYKHEMVLGLESLTGAFADEPLRLAKPLTFRRRGDAIQLSDLDFRLGEARLTGNIDVDERSVAGVIDLRSLPLAWSETLGGAPLSGTVSADVDMGGEIDAPRIDAVVQADDVLARGFADDELPFDILLTAKLDRDRLDAELTGSGVTEEPITATVSLPAHLKLAPFALDLPKDGQLQGKIDANILLARLADILALDDQTMKGTLFADIAIGGTFGEPKIEGPIRVEGGAYENGATGTDIRDLVVAATASNERIDITEFTGSTGKKGTIAFDGGLALDAQSNFPLSFTLRLDQARLVDRDDIEARISGDVAMTGDFGNAEINGELEVDRAEISLPESGGPNLPELEVTEVGGRIVNPPEEERDEEERASPFDPTLDMRVKLPNKVYVRGRGLESEWQGDLRISGSASQPIIVGSLEIKKGFFDFLDKRFELEVGEVTFSGNSPPNPILALEAVSEEPDFTAIIKLSGPADDPQLLLSSEPVLPEDEVLARLLFNRELSEIGPVEAGKLAFALNRLRGGGGFDAFGEIRNILKIDTLDVVSDEEGESRVKAGKYINDEIYVEVEQGAGEESGRARVEIELLPNVALEADTSDGANSGVGLKWKFNY